MRFTVIFFTVWLLSLSLSVPVLAAPADNALRAQRALFRTLYPKAQAGGWASIKESAAALDSYPLYPYLEAADLEYRLRRGNARDTQLSALFTRYPDLGAAKSLRNRWIKDLARRGEWKHVAEFSSPGDDPELRCLQVYARIRTGNGNDVLQEIQQLWLTPKSLPDACDRVFDWFDNRGLLTPALIQSRINRAIAADEPRLVKWLARKLAGNARRNAELWLDIRNDPLDELRSLIKHPKPWVSADVIAQGLRRAARKHTLKAAELYDGLARHYLKTAAERDQALGLLGLEMALDRDVEALAWYSKLQHNPTDTKAREWRVRTAIYHSAWDKARSWIEQMPQSEREEQVWRYWLARSYEGLPGPDNALKARAQYAALAVERGYYPYLAADRLKQKYSLRNQPVPANLALRSKVENLPGAQRSREFYALDLLAQAHNEWRHFTAGLSEAELQQSAVLANSWGWHPEAIMTLARAKYWDDLPLRYPLLYKNETLSAAGKAAVDSGWVYGIMRSESLFVPHARSPAKAIGLMQLLPSTGRQVARGLGIAYHGERTLLDPATNLRLGAEYLRQMRNRFDGNLAMASAAYNAGPHRVKHWLPQARMPADIWVENIPFDETRSYVQRVLEHAVAFDWRLDRDITPLSTRMPPVPPR